MKTLFPLLSVFVVASARAESAEWLEGTVLADCEYCKTDAFRLERKTLANQLGPKRDPAWMDHTNSIMDVCARDCDCACVLAPVKGRPLRGRPALRAGFALDWRSARQAAGASPASVA